MRIALISGLWPTSDYNGLEQLSNKLLALSSSVSCHLWHYDDYVDLNYDAYIGHSFGASKCRDLISQAPYVQYWGIIDGVDYHWDAKNNFMVPRKVSKADCFKRKEPCFFGAPPSSAILNENESYKNYEIKMGGFPLWFGPHADAPRNTEVQNGIVTSIKSIL